MATRTEFDQIPAQFARAVEQVKSVELRPEVSIEELPAPQRIASYAYALSGDIEIGATDLATGRFIVLHEPDGHDAWEGTFRCVTFAKAEIEAEMAADPILTEVGWAWLTDALESRSASFHAASGSVTVVRSSSFGALSEEGGSAQIEVRASWTPTSELASHASAWVHLLSTVAGLPPITAGVVPLLPKRDSR